MSSCKRLFKTKIQIRPTHTLFLVISVVFLQIHDCQSFQSEVTSHLHCLPQTSYIKWYFPCQFSNKHITSKSEVSIFLQKDNSMEPARPDWALEWMPTWLITMRPIYQLMLTASFFFFHLKVLTQNSISFPFQLIPNNYGYFQSIGLDSIAGMLSLAGYLLLRRVTNHKLKQAIPSLIEAPKRSKKPWRFPKADSGPKSSAFLAGLMLLHVYSKETARFSYFWEDFLYSMAGMGFQMTVPMHRALTVLLGHLSWVISGGLILHLVPRPQPFFGGGHETEEMENGNHKKGKEKLHQFRWFTNKWNTYWLWWTIGGYFVTSWLYNLADFFNQIFIPHHVFESSPEGVVELLINPENNDWLASFVGCLAPCWTAPWWEEILYRGFMLPALCFYMPYGIALWLSGLIFSLHHMSLVSAIPLLVLGWTWGDLYTKSGNLLVTILVHCMWNSRVFLGNWLGL